MMEIRSARPVWLFALFVNAGWGLVQILSYARLLAAHLGWADYFSLPIHLVDLYLDLPVWAVLFGAINPALYATAFLLLLLRKPAAAVIFSLAVAADIIQWLLYSSSIFYAVHWDWYAAMTDWLVNLGLGMTAWLLFRLKSIGWLSH